MHRLIDLIKYYLFVPFFPAINIIIRKLLGSPSLMIISGKNIDSPVSSVSIR